MQFMITGGYVEGNSFVHKRDAFIKLLCMLVLLVAVILADSLVGVLVISVMLVLLIMLADIGFKNALNGVRHLWLFFLLIFLMNSLFTQAEDVLLEWWIFQISGQGIIQGTNVVLQVAFAMILGNVLISTTSPLKITGAIETLIIPLKYLGVPVRDVAMILGVAIQFVPTFIHEADMIKKAQIARGARFESKKLLEKAHSIVALVVPIFISAFSRADELAVAMEARGYRRSRKQVIRRKRSISTPDMLSLLVCCMVCIIEMSIL